MSYKNRYEVYYKIYDEHIENNSGQIILTTSSSSMFPVEEVARCQIFQQFSCNYNDIEIQEMYLLDSEFIDDEM